MASKRLYFIYNSRAGKGQISSRLSGILTEMTKAGYEVTVHPTMRARDAIESIENLGPGYDLVVASGGDGTLDEVVTGMMRRGLDPIPIGYIPAGSTNDFASSLEIPSNMMTATEDLLRGVPFPCDVGMFQTGYFIYIAAFGVFTDVSYETPREMKNIFGHLAYILEGARRLSSIKSYKMKVHYDGETVEGDFIYGMVTNSKSVAGFRNMVKKQKIVFDDGVFEVTLIRKPRNFLELQNIASALMIDPIDSKYVLSFKAKEIVFESRKDVAWTLDGEFGGAHKVVKIENLQKAVSIVLPEERLERVSERFLVKGENE